ncbi:MAG: hypothetical protein AAGJ94_02900 [Pseudomonadota bacterium]
MKRSILALMVMSLALGGCNTAYNYFEDDDEGAPTPAGGFNLANALMKQTGVVPKDKRALTYKPRAPLAMPASTDLPNPEDRNGSNAAEVAVNFPVDHADQEKDRKERLSAALANGQTLPPAGSNTAVDADGNPTSVQGLGLSPADPIEPPSRRERMKPGEWEKSPIRSVKEMKRKLNFQTPDRELLTAQGKPAQRRYLIQPPTEYRTPAESAALPEKGDIEKSEWLRKQLYRDHTKGR